MKGPPPEPAPHHLEEDRHHRPRAQRDAGGGVYPADIREVVVQLPAGVAQVALSPGGRQQPLVAVVIDPGQCHIGAHHQGDEEADRHRPQQLALSYAGGVCDLHRLQDVPGDRLQAAAIGDGGEPGPIEHHQVPRHEDRVAEGGHDELLRKERIGEKPQARFRAQPSPGHVVD